MYDVLISGAGPAGSKCAEILAKFNPHEHLVKNRVFEDLDMYYKITVDV